MEVAYQQHGRAGADGPTVVLVHGWAGDASTWVNQIDVLAARYHVVTVELGGHGRSGFGRDDWTLAAFGDDVVAVVEEIGARDVVLVGHSMGGDAITFAARALGDRVRGLVWVDAFRSLGDEPFSSAEDVDTFLGPFRADFPTAVDRFARGMFADHADPALVDRVAGAMAAAAMDATLGSLGYALNRHPPVIAALADLHLPIVAINPDAGPTDVESLRRHGVEPVVLDGVGHFLMLEDPEPFNRVLTSTLASFFA